MQNLILALISIKISFDIGSLLVFITGIVFGVTISLLLYVYFVLNTLKEKKYYVDSEVAHNVTEEDIKNIIKNYQELYLAQRKNENKEIANNALKDAIFGVVHDVAARFFPESKKPLFELTIDELTMLMHYISKRVDDLLGYRGLRVIRKIKVSHIMNIVDTSKKVNNNEIVQKAKKYQLSKIFKISMAALNIINPVYWIKKTATIISKKVILKKIVLIIISIAGEETYKIYSKQAFKEQDPEYIKMMSEIEDALQNSEDIDEFDENTLDEFVDELPEDEKTLLLSLPHNSKKKWWKRKNKEKITN